MLSANDGIRAGDLKLFEFRDHHETNRFLKRNRELVVVGFGLTSRGLVYVMVIGVLGGEY